MVLAAALISLAVLAPPAEPQSAPRDESKPYTVEGVRRAMASETAPAPIVTLAESGPRGHKMTVESTYQPVSTCVACGPSRGSWWADASYPTWHDQFIAMTGPQGYAIPYSGMNNSQKLQAIGTSVAFGLVIQAITSAIEGGVAKISSDRKQRKVEKIRREIRDELEVLERLNAAARGSGQPGVR
jgi:hypothetical protein